MTCNRELDFFPETKLITLSADILPYLKADMFNFLKIEINYFLVHVGY